MWILGGGSPKNFLLQTEPQIQEVLGIAEKGHDYFLALTDARPDTGGPVGRDAGRGGELGQDRSRAAAGHGDLLRRLDASTLPLLTAYALARRAPRRLKRLYDRRGDLMKRLRETYYASGRAAAVAEKK